ncbi:MAG: choice-of-anchor L domain-containing protein [Myxococcales bacterium]|nr:choice-of-anchor L domain-containing protein [Myxococcales bacterium]MCB9751713.1 choice-of-anchor L domain-containing protein [Myxococcales bacterium]
MKRTREFLGVIGVCALVIGCGDSDGRTSLSSAETNNITTNSSNSSAMTTDDVTATDASTTNMDTTAGTTQTPTTDNPTTQNVTTDSTSTTTGMPTTEDPSEGTTDANVCGNGVQEDDNGEFCDGDDLPFFKCKDYNSDKYSGGNLSCAISCKYNFSDCVQIQCEAPPNHLPCDDDSDEFLHALGINCYTIDVQQWTDQNSNYALDFLLLSADTSAYRIVKQYGSYFNGNQPYWSPTEGDRFVLISNGQFPQVDLQGKLLAPPGSAQNGGQTNNMNPSNVPSLPGVMKWQQGSNNGDGGTPFFDCDGNNDCSDTLDAQWNQGAKIANDVIYFEVDLQVPKGTFGYKIDFAFFSAEYPEYVNGGEFNDMAIVWSTSEAYTGNVTFLIDENDVPQPLTVTALANAGLITLVSDSPELKDTGYDQVGGATPWVTATGPAKPSEQFTLAFTVFDKVDAEINTALALDNFRWDCAGCNIEQAEGCGIG